MAIISKNDGRFKKGHVESLETKQKRSLSMKGHPGWNKKHGMDGTSIYKTWISMKARCLNKNDKDYGKYGGRGINVCDEWKKSFEEFYKDMGDKPTPKHSLDRIDVNGNYCKENCRWATIHEQNNNKTNSHLIELNGKRLTIAQWSKELGIAPSTILNRVYRRLTSEQILSTKIRNKNNGN